MKCMYFCQRESPQFKYSHGIAATKQHIKILYIKMQCFPKHVNYLTTKLLSRFYRKKVTALKRSYFFPLWGTKEPANVDVQNAIICK